MKLVENVTDIAVATSSEGKIREVTRLWDTLKIPAKLHFEGAAEGVEVASTYAGNALLKTQEVARRTGMYALGDDSGIACRLWGFNFPGPYSARLRGVVGVTSDGVVTEIDENLLSSKDGDSKNNKQLLKLLANASEKEREAQYFCNLSFVHPDGREIVAVEGRMSGKIVDEPRGKGGFGYDPYFELAPFETELFGDETFDGATAAELPDLTKDLISHRGRAFTKFAAIFRELMARV